MGPRNDACRQAMRQLVFGIEPLDERLLFGHDCAFA
jgi:hypothetical protein